MPLRPQGRDTSRAESNNLQSERGIPTPEHEKEMASLSRLGSKKFMDLASMVITEEETTAEAVWKLPKISEKAVYNYNNLFGLRSSSFFFNSRHVTSIAHSNDGKFFNVSSLWHALKPQAIQKGYKFVHLGLIQVGINPMFRKGLPITCIAFLLDTRFKSFDYQYLGGLEGKLCDGPMYLQIRPNYNLSLDDPYFDSCIQLHILVDTPELKHEALNIEVAFNMIGRCVNTGLPAITQGKLSSAEKQKSLIGKDIILKADAKSTILRCAEIPWESLKPPKEWPVDISPTLQNEIIPQSLLQIKYSEDQKEKQKVYVSSRINLQPNDASTSSSSSLHSAICTKCDSEMHLHHVGMVHHVSMISAYSHANEISFTNGAEEIKAVPYISPANNASWQP